MPSKNKFEVNGDTIIISHEGWESLAYATYRDDYYSELSSYTWILKNGYPYNAALGGGLHRYMMAKWYGTEALKDFTDRGYVVDHMNNNHMDCQITNLEFLKKSYNTAKGQFFDVDAREMKYRIAVNIFKDFSTGYYQITIGCNDPIVYENANGECRLISDIKLLYDCDYSIVINDAENILRIYDTEKRLPISTLNACEIRVNFAQYTQLTEEEKGRVFIERDGQKYIVTGNGHTFISNVHFDKGWKPSQK